MKEGKILRPDRIGSYFQAEWLPLALVAGSGLAYNLGLLATPWFEGRLALARTLAHPRPVLILDDPFSALDRSTENTAFANLREYAKDKVVFLISQRLYHFPETRKVIFMEDGKVSVGTHGELMDSQPVYRQLYESQTGGQTHED